MSFWQGARLWRDEIIRVRVLMKNGGCVATTATLLRNRLLGMNTTPLDTLSILRHSPGCLVDADGNEPGDLLAWPASAKALGLVADVAVAAAANNVHHELVDHTIDPNVDLAQALAAACLVGGAAVRVDVDGDGYGDHTIACYTRLADTGEFLCDDPALGAEIRLDPNLEAPTVRWGGASYRAVGVRGIRLA